MSENDAWFDSVRFMRRYSTTFSQAFALLVDGTGSREPMEFDSELEIIRESFDLMKLLRLDDPGWDARVKFEHVVFRFQNRVLEFPLLDADYSPGTRLGVVLLEKAFGDFVSRKELVLARNLRVLDDVGWKNRHPSICVSRS